MLRAFDDDRTRSEHEVETNPTKESPKRCLPQGSPSPTSKKEKSSDRAGVNPNTTTQPRRRSPAHVLSHSSRTKVPSSPSGFRLNNEDYLKRVRVREAEDRERTSTGERLKLKRMSQKKQPLDLVVDPQDDNAGGAATEHGRGDERSSRRQASTWQQQPGLAACFPRPLGASEAPAPLPPPQSQQQLRERKPTRERRTWSTTSSSQASPSGSSSGSSPSDSNSNSSPNGSSSSRSSPEKSDDRRHRKQQQRRRGRRQQQQMGQQQQQQQQQMGQQQQQQQQQGDDEEEGAPSVDFEAFGQHYALQSREQVENTPHGRHENAETFDRVTSSSESSLGRDSRFSTRSPVARKDKKKGRHQDQRRPRREDNDGFEFRDKAFGMRGRGQGGNRLPDRRGRAKKRSQSNFSRSSSSSSPSFSSSSSPTNSSDSRPSEADGAPPSARSSAAMKYEKNHRQQQQQQQQQQQSDDEEEGAPSVDFEAFGQHYALQSREQVENSPHARTFDRFTSSSDSSLDRDSFFSTRSSAARKDKKKGRHQDQQHPRKEDSDGCEFRDQEFGMLGRGQGGNRFHDRRGRAQKRSQSNPSIASFSSPPPSADPSSSSHSDADGDSSPSARSSAARKDKSKHRKQLQQRQTPSPTGWPSSPSSLSSPERSPSGDSGWELGWEDDDSFVFEASTVGDGKAVGAEVFVREGLGFGESGPSIGATPRGRDDMLGAWCPTKTLDVSKDKVSAQNLGFRTSLDLDAVRVTVLSLMHVGKAVRGSRKAGGAVEGKDAAVLMLLKNPALNKALKRAKFTFRANHGVNARALKPQDIPNICVGTVVGDKRLGSFDMFMLMTCDFDNDDELHAAKKGQTKAISRARIDSYQEALSKTVQGFAEDSRFADALRGSNHSVEDLARSTSDEHFHLPLDDRSRSEFFYELNKNVRKSFGIGRGRPEIAIVFKAFNQKFDTTQPLLASRLERQCVKYAKFIDKLIKSAFRVDREDLELSVDIAGETLALPLERPQTNDGSDRVQLYPSSEYYAGMKASQRGAPGGLSEELGFNVVDVYSLSCTEQCGSIAASSRKGSDAPIVPWSNEMDGVKGTKNDHQTPSGAVQRSRMNVYNASEYHCSRIKGKNLFKEALGKSPFSSRVEFARGIALSGGHPGAESTRSLDKAREKAKEVAVACLAAFEANPGGIRSEMTYNFLPWVGGDNRITLRQALEVMVGDLAFRVLRIDDTGSIPEDSVFPLRSSVIHLLQNANLTRCIEALSAGIVDPDEDKSSVDLQLPLGHLPTVAEGLLSEGASAVRMFEVGKCLRRGLGATGFTGFLAEDIEWIAKPGCDPGKLPIGRYIGRGGGKAGSGFQKGSRDFLQAYSGSLPAPGAGPTLLEDDARRLKALLNSIVNLIADGQRELLLKKRLIDKGESKDAGGAGADPQWMPTEQELLAAGAERNDGKSVKIADGGAICVGPSLKHILPDHRGKPLEKIPSPYATIFNSVVLALRSLDDPYGWVIHLVALAWVGRCSLFSETRHGRLFRVIGHFNKVDGRGAKEFLTATRSQYNVAEDAKRDDLAELIACLGACLGRVASSGSTAPRTKRDPKPAARPPTANGWALLKRFESQTDSGFYVPRQPVAWLAVTVLHPDGYSKGGSKGFAPAILQHYAYRKRNDWIGKMEKNKGPNKQRKAFEAWKQKVDTAMGQLFDPGEAGSLRGKTSRERAVARFDAGKTRLAIADGGGNLDYSALKVWIRLGITVGQLLASASAMLSGVETLGEGDDILKTLESILESNEASSRNFFSVFVEPEAGVDDDSTSLASAIAGLDPECGPDPKGLKLHTYGVHREEWEGFVKAAADFANS